MSCWRSCGFSGSAQQWRWFPRDCGGSARRSLMTERSERMSEEAQRRPVVHGHLRAGA
ncbi:hypothetical protein [Escherichia coli]|uniref:hypothetical protein n=1 Tax=Escherichia coli TaxID=562 RepID=UPI001ABB8F57|nr:hypothetical protein [Escherichia coli]HDP9339543.1 hypothetical protein [Escherichia coli]HDQ0384207.1 hypothetical protein [Escherichia coli]